MEQFMNRDQVKGRAKEATGKAKEVAGKATSNRSLQGKGMAEKVVGKVQKHLGDAVERDRKATRRQTH
jgi:uncharacterized protein YjbJ (UPF0337 family)